MAGIIGAASNNGYGVAGVAWSVRILPVRVLGLCGGTDSDIINGMYWAAGLPVPGVPINPSPARIINMSLGSRVPAPTCSQAYQTAVQAISAAGSIIVAAAGNNAPTGFGEAGFYQPSGCAGVLTVAATDHLGYRASYSDYSNEFVVDISAPGGDISYYHDVTKGIYSTVDSGLRTPEGPTGAWYQGTSQAAPHVSGILALMLSVNPALTNKQLYWTLLEGSREFNSSSVCYRDSVCGWGIANAFTAVTKARADPANGPTTVSVSSSANPSNFGQSFTLWAAVSPSNVTGTVTFLSAGTPITGCTNLQVVSGSVGCTFNNWAVNAAGYQLSAVFNGDGTHHWSYSNVVAQVVNSTTAASANYQGLWWAAPAGAQSGWGINFAHQGDVIFATWFTYDTSGRAWWLGMQANKTPSGIYVGTVFTTHGPAFNAVQFDPTKVTETPVGSATLTFTDVNTALFTYTVNGISQTKTLVREIFGSSVPVCTFGSSVPQAQATNYQDLWWASPAGSESGWGVNLTHQGDVIFATWFTYDANGNPMWLSGPATKTGPGVYFGTLARTTGPAFNAVPFDPAQVMEMPVGVFTLTFTDGANGTFAYTVNGVSQIKAITREVFVAPGTVCQ